jgi:haloalkane dehalogenase
VTADAAAADRGARPPWLSQELYPFESHYAQVEGASVHYVDEGAGPPLLMLHGNPTWSFLYRDLIKGLRDRFRCIAVDYPGFGLSRAAPAYGYTPAEHAKVVERLILDLDLGEVTMMVQDWGGPIGFGLCVRRPERVARLVVLNTGIGARAPNDAWLRFQAFMRRVGTSVDAGSLVRQTLVQPVTDEVIAAYDAPFPVPESRVGIVQFPELVATSSGHPSAPAMLDVRNRLGSFEQPALVLFSDSDPIFSRRAAEVMAELLPNAALDPPVEGAGHFLQEDRGEIVGRRIAEWVASR